MFERIANPIKPCIDCKWTFLLVRDKPIILLHCNRCKRWFRVNKWEYVDNTVIKAQCDGDDIYLDDMFSCDCLIRLITVGYIGGCYKCAGPYTSIHLSMHSNNTLWNLLLRICGRVEEGSAHVLMLSFFPESMYTRRCSADKQLMNACFRAFPAMKGAIKGHQALRKKQQEQHRLMLNTLNKGRR